MSTEDIPSDKRTHGLQPVVIETASIQPTPLYKQIGHTLDEASSTSSKIEPSDTNLRKFGFDSKRQCFQLSRTNKLKDWFYNGLKLKRQTEVSLERHKQIAKNLSTNIQTKRRDVSPGIQMMPMENDLKMNEIVVMTAPTSSKPVAASPIPTAKVDDNLKDDTDSITSEITELRTPEVAKKPPEWSAEEEAHGLSRNESRASRTSRVSNAVRQFFCCGLQIQAPSEDNISSPRDDYCHSGI